MAATLCRNGQHPIEDRVRNGRGRVQCAGCKRERASQRNMTVPIVWDGWLDPAIREERRQWLEAWTASIDATIARIRAEEGFDSSRRRWQTLGECLLPEPMPEPHPLTRISGRRMVRCGRCGTRLWEGDACGYCPAGLDAHGRRLVS